jgi:hypothetical protein
MKTNFMKLSYIFCFLFLNIFLNIYHKHNFGNNYKIINKKNYNALIVKFNKSSHYKYLNTSKDYWEERYANGGNSGSGSYNNLALFKASIINNFVDKNKIKTVIEWGCGDCNQLLLANYKNYIGYDVSKTAIKICQKKFKNDTTKTFIHLSDNVLMDKKADLSISLDVLYHILEDDIFNIYMKNLFNSSKKYVCIYSTNYDSQQIQHIKHRKFTDWIDKYISNEWKIKEHIPNKYYFKLNNQDSISFADFYFYEKIK